MQNVITIAQLIELINRYDKKNQTQHGRSVLEFIYRELSPDLVGDKSPT